MIPIRWKVAPLHVQCPEGHTFEVQSTPNFVVSHVPDDTETAPVMISLPTRCPKCEPNAYPSEPARPQLRLVKG